NDAPTFDSVGDVVVEEDSGETLVAVTSVAAGGGADETDQEIALTVTMDVAGVLYDPVVSGSGASRTLAIQPVADANGVVTVTITLDDGGDSVSPSVSSSSATFTVTVDAVNDAPSFDLVADVAVAEDSAAIDIDVTGVTSGGGADEAAQDVFFTAVSSDAFALADPLVSGSGSTRTLTLVPSPDAVGSITVTLTATDDGGVSLSGEDTYARDFVVTISGVNDVPVADAQAATTDEDTAVTITLTATELDADAVTYALLDGSTQVSTLTTANGATVSLAAEGASGTYIEQWASSVIDFSTEYSSGSWSAAQVLGEPNTFGYGDISTSWTSASANGTIEYLQVGYDVPVYADGAVVRETYGNGMVFQIDVMDTLGALHTVWSDIDTSPAGAPYDFTVTWARTGFLVSGLKVWLDTDHTSSWEEIDTIQLLGSPDTPGTATASALYTPAAEFTGTDTFQFVVSDDTSVSEAAMVTVTVGAVNDPPSFDTIGDIAVDEDTAQIVVDVTGITSGGAGTEETQTVTLTAAVDGGTVVGVPTIAQEESSATITLVPVADASGVATVTVTAVDSGDSVAPSVNTYSADFAITVTAVNDPPVADTPSSAFAVTEGATVDIPLTASDVDADGVSLSLWDGAEPLDTLTTANAGTVTLVAASGASDVATATYTPPAGFDGSDTFQFVAYDGEAYSAAATVTVAVGSLPRVSIDDVTVVEGDADSTTADFTVSLTAASDASVTVDYGTAADTAVSSVDYTAAFDTVTFDAGSVSQVVSITVHGDLTFELDDTFFVDLSAASGAVLEDAQGIATITNDDPIPTLTIADVAVAEGDLATLAVTMSNASDLTTTVAYASADGTATDVDDYTGVAGELTIDAGVDAATIDLEVADDTTNEADETFSVELTSPDGATLAQATATVTIADDDDIVITVDDASVTEDDASAPSATFVVSLSGASEQTVAVAYATADGEAVAGADYTHTAGTLLIEPGAIAESIGVPVLSDDVNEPTETFGVSLSDVVGRGVSLAVDLVTGSIVDDDSLSIDGADGSVTEGDDADVALLFAVSLSRASDSEVTVDYVLTESDTDPADLAADIVGATAGTVAFAPGEITADISIAVAGDAINEPDESVTLTLSNPTGPNATLAGTSFSGVIVDNDDIVVSVVASEAGEASATMLVAVALSGESQQSVTVSYATADGSATAGADYEAATGDVTIEPGATSASVTVTLLDDAVHELDETFTVSLSEATGRGVSVDATAPDVTITNDDPVPSLSVSDVTVAEGDVSATFAVSLTGATSADVTVAYATADIGAHAGEDYDAASGTLTIEAGATAAEIAVTLIDDTDPEADEAFILSLRNATDATLADGQAVATILDNDEPPTIALLAPGDGSSFAASTPSVEVSVETAHHAGTWRWKLGADFDIADAFDGDLVPEGSTATADGLVDGQAYRVYVALADVEGALLDPLVGAEAVFGVGREVRADAREFAYDLPAGPSLFSLTLDPLFLTNGDVTINVGDASGRPLASHLIQMGATVVTRAVDGSFAAAIGRDGAIVFGSDFSLVAGSAYIVNMPEATSFTLEGLPLGDAVADTLLAAPDAQPHVAPWVFAVGVEMTAGTTLPDGAHLRVWNNRSGDQAVATRVADSRYGVTFVDDDREGVPADGDTLSFELVTREGYRLDVQHDARVTREDSQYASVVVRMDARPTTTAVLPNYPNPFNPETWIPFTLTTASEATVRIYDVSGTVVRMLDLGRRAAGHYVSRADAAHWDGRNAAGEVVGSGVYFYEFVAGEARPTVRRMVIRK
ncbi:hypothetical protein HOK31_00520, partial [Candidatus Poribacteria bacterium]|nr:hypothetical protein [Candidatus Poribacteria bacterium]